MKTKIVAIDLFCGVEGLTHGFIKQGISIVAGIDNDYVEIYIYLSARLILKAKRIKEEALPNVFKKSLKNGLSEYRESLLRELRCKIFRARGRRIRHPVFDALEEVFKESVKRGRRK